MTKRLNELQELAQEALRAVRDCEASTDARIETLDEIESYALMCAEDLRASVRAAMAGGEHGT